MAKYFLYVKVFSRGKGSRVTRVAAYRAGERIRDELTSEVYNYSLRAVAIAIASFAIVLLSMSGPQCR